MEPSSGPPIPTVEQLRHVVNHFPIIDSHAHNLIRPNLADTIPFESITTEAQGRALRDTFKSLPHLRAARQLRHLYECGEDADWEDILEQRIEWLRSDPQRLHQRCLEGIHAWLIDDGLAEPRKVYPYDAHDGYFQAPSKRIVRVETVAERLMERLVRDAKESDLGKTKFLPDLWVEFTDEFEREIQEAVRDPEVAAFKSVVCYRTGLDIEPDYEEAAKAVGHPFERYVKACIRKRSYRIERKPLNDYLVLRTLEILSDDLPHSDSLAKPLQLHTGLGDNDIKLAESNPALLQQVIEAYPNVPFVLLHLAYPYTQEAAYLATVYRHVYLDIGEVFPMISRDGQETILRQVIELVPGSKLLYSSDGRWFPETFYLANLQFRQVWLELLIEYVEKSDLTVFQAIAMTKDVMFNNSNVLYNLHYQATFDETIQEAPKQLTYNSKPVTGSPYPSPSIPPIPPAGTTSQPVSGGPVDPRSGSPYEPPAFPPPPTVPHVYDDQILESFMQENPDVRFVYVQWLDYTATICTRVVPIKEFSRMIHQGDRIEVFQADEGTLQNDIVTPAATIDEPIYVEPDLRSLRQTHNKDPLPSATVLSYWRSESGTPLPTCPRTSLETLINTLQYTHGTTLLVGFTIDVTLLSRNDNTHPQAPRQPAFFSPTMTPEQWLQSPVLSVIVTALDKMGIDIQQFHVKSSSGQFEFMLPAQPPLLAIDTLTQARQAISQIANLHGYRATLYPRPSENTATTALAQISLHPPEKDMAFFVGGVLKHLPAICAFSMPDASSYRPGTNDTPPEATWLAWSSLTRNVPLRRLKSNRWEIASLDGLANMYLALSAIVGAGLLGLQSGHGDFAETDLDVDPSRLDEDGRARYGVVERMPGRFAEAVRALESDTELGEMMHHGVVDRYVNWKAREQGKLNKLNEEDRRQWIIKRF